MQNNPRLEHEAAHFDQMISGKSSEIIFYDAPFVKNVMEDLNEVTFGKLGNLQGKSILFYGSGANFAPIQKMIDAKSRKVCAIDISPKSIEIIQRLVDETDLSGLVYPEVMDCMDLKYADNTFDRVYGRAILHHLDLQSAFNEIFRILKPGGVAVFLEPLGMNPFINLFRKLTPERRTADEHPFVRTDFLEMEKYPFSRIEYQSVNLLVNLGIFVSTSVKPIKLDRKAYLFLKNMDQFLLKHFSLLNRFCWNTIITLTK